MIKEQTPRAVDQEKRPFELRGGLPFEIAPLVGSTQVRVTDPEALSIVNRRITFARALQQERFITDDLTYWQLTHKIYRMRRKQGTSNLDFAGKLVLEAFVMADRKAKRERDTSLLEKFQKVATTIDERLFEQDVQLAEAMRVTDAGLEKFEQKRKLLAAVWTDPQSAATRRKNIAEANRRRTEIRYKVFALALRGCLTVDIIPITGFKPDQVSNALNHMRNPKKPNDPYELPNPTPQQASEAHRRALVGRKRGEPRVYTEEQLQMFELLRNFQDEGFITADLSIWNELFVLYEQFGRSMPDEPTQRALLEMYAKALKAYVTWDNKTVNAYKRIVGETAQTLLKDLSSEIAFIRRKLFSPWADGEDNNGLYFLRDGRKHYRPGGEGMVCENSNMAIRRERIKNKRDDKTRRKK